MMQVYRSWEKVKGMNHPEQYYSEICRACAKEELEAGRDIQFDGYLSNIDPVNKSDICQKCLGSFFVDGRKIKKKLKEEQ